MLSPSVTETEMAPACTQIGLHRNHLLCSTLAHSRELRAARCIPCLSTYAARPRMLTNRGCVGLQRSPRRPSRANRIVESRAPSSAKAVCERASARHRRGPQRRRAAPEPGPDGAEMTLGFSRRAERGCLLRFPRETLHGGPQMAEVKRSISDSGNSPGSSARRLLLWF